jgi:hypothetical protein
MSTTADREDPELGRGVDESPTTQHKKYLVLSEEERAKGFVRPLRRSYRHVGAAGPKHPLRDLTEEETQRFGRFEYAKYEMYPKGGDKIGRYWTQKQLDSVGVGCGAVTSMSQEIAETYARKPSFYGATYCIGCSMHRPVGEDGEFVWDGTDERVGT